MPVRTGDDVGQFGSCCCCLRADRPGTRGKDRAFDRCRRTVPTAIEQADAKLLFKANEAFGDGRLGYAQRLAGSLVTTEIDHCQEVAQLLQVDREFLRRRR